MLSIWLVISNHGHVIMELEKKKKNTMSTFAFLTLYSIISDYDLSVEIPSNIILNLVEFVQAFEYFCDI